MARSRVSSLPSSNSTPTIQLLVRLSIPRPIYSVYLPHTSELHPSWAISFSVRLSAISYERLPRTLANQAGVIATNKCRRELILAWAVGLYGILAPFQERTLTRNSFSQPWGRLQFVVWPSTLQKGRGQALESTHVCLSHVSETYLVRSSRLLV